MPISPPKSIRISVAVSMVLAAGSLSMNTAVAQNSYSSSTDLGFAGIDVCKPDILEVPQILKDAPVGNQDEQPTNIESDEISTEDGNTLQLKGNAQVVQGNRGLFAESITFNQETYQAKASGDVVLYTGGSDQIRADSLQIEVDTFIGSATGTEIKFAADTAYFTEREHYKFEEDYSILAPFRNKTVEVEEPEEYDPLLDPNTYVRARASSESMDFEGKSFQRLHDARLTTCAEGNDDVVLVAKQIELDHSTGVGTAENLTVRFKKVPIFYFPTVSFPINDERKTGFLFPGIGYEKDSGYILSIPYYINISPQLDATITPTVYSHRGVQLFGEFRYMTERGRGAIKAETLPGDDVFGDDRHALSFDHEHDFTDKWEASIDINDISDTDYLSDFSSDVDVSGSTYVPQNAQLSYRGDAVRFRARASAYERVNSDVSVASQPYERLPQVTFDIREQSIGDFRWGFESEVTNYSHDDETRVDGTRVNTLPYISYEMEEIYGYVTPRLSVQTISYSLDNNPFPDDSPSVSVPIASIDSGLFFERLIKRPKKDKVYLQTLEPRLFYVNIPEELEQEQFPDFDTGGGSTSSFSHFFRENRFFGGDRVGDTNQLSFGLTSRIIDDDSGEERLKLSIGQVFYFDDREVGLTPDSDPDTEDTSDFLAEISTSLNEDWDLTGFARWSAEEYDLEFFRASADYYHSNRRNASIGYNISRDENQITTSEQLNLDFETPIGSHWQLGGRVDYSIEDEEVRRSEIGFTYDGCCWAASLRAQRRVQSGGEFENRFIVTFELDDLGKISSRL